MSCKTPAGRGWVRPPVSISINSARISATRDRCDTSQARSSSAHIRLVCGWDEKRPSPFFSNSEVTAGDTSRRSLSSADRNSSGAASASSGSRYASENQRFGAAFSRSSRTRTAARQLDPSGAPWGVLSPRAPSSATVSAIPSRICGENRGKSLRTPAR